MAVDVEFLNGNNVNNINNNFQRVKNALQEVVGRNGNLPNHMNADLDMNSNDILNVDRIDLQRIVVDGEDFDPRQMRGWAPVFSAIEYNGTVVMKLVDYVGGQGIKPTQYIDWYVGSTGYVQDISQATGFGSSGITDGDKGGIVVSGAGANWQIKDGDKGGITVSDSGAKWELARDRKTVADLLADTVLSYSAGSGKTVVAPGNVITAQGFRYEVTASDAMDYHVETVGGVRLLVLASTDGYAAAAFGVVGDGITDNTVALAKAKDVSDAANTPLILPEGRIISGPITFNYSSQWRGQGKRGKTVLDFSALTSGSAISIAKIPGESVVGMHLSDFDILGNEDIIGIDAGLIAFGGDPYAALVDSSFERIEVIGCAIGLKTQSIWDNSFRDIRLKDCLKPAELGSQTNAIHFDTCQLVTFTETITLINCEGILFSNCDISNAAASVAMSFFQSTASFVNPYFELIDDYLFTIGSGSEVVKSHVTVEGGLFSQTGAKIGISGAGDGPSLTVNGTRCYAADFRIDQNGGLPVMPMTYLSVRLSGTAEVNPPQRRIMHVDYGRKPRLATHDNNDVYVEMGSSWMGLGSGSGNGIILSDALTVGEQYTLALAVRKGSIGQDFGFGIGDTGVEAAGGFSAPGEEWAVRLLPFIAASTKLRMAWSGILQVKFISIYEGIPDDVKIPEPSMLYADEPPGPGSSTPNALGTYIMNDRPLTSEPFGWLCWSAGTPGSWGPFGTIS